MGRRRTNVFWVFVFLAGAVWVARSVLSPESFRLPSPPPRGDDPWVSPAACQRLVAGGARAPRTKDGVRVVSWNLRWFPDGSAGRPGSRPTDVAWLACTLTWLDADVFAAQEVKADPASAERWQALMDALSLGGGGRWKSVLDTCPRDGRGHVALAWDETRVEVDAPGHHPTLNGAGGGACTDRLRPGLSAYVRRRTGEGTGLDLSVVTLHADSGREARDARRRAAAATALSLVAGALATERTDPDVLVVGDFNAMGADEPALAEHDERTRLDATLGAGAPPLAPVAVRGPACSHYYRGRPSALDLAFATDGLEAVYEVSGYCRALACQKLSGRWPGAYERLSDHCPLTVDLVGSGGTGPSGTE